ncbi:hypothetical protein ACP4OV_009030 [Aristida adscensionis]
MAVGAVVSPANPALIESQATAVEVYGLAALSRPSVPFAVHGTAAKLPPGLATVLLDSEEFLTFLQQPPHGGAAVLPETDAAIRQADAAAILGSSGTTGCAKAAVLAHRNLIAVPMFHVYGFMFCLRAALAAQTLVLHTAAARRLDAPAVLAAVATFRVARLALSPPALLAGGGGRRCGGGRVVTCGGVPTAAGLVRRFLRKFPDACLFLVPPAELEHLLQTHPDIVEAAVVPYPDDHAGELPVAFIVRRSGSDLQEEQIKEFVTKQVVHYKRIHHVFLVDLIPKNAAGKILRTDLAKLVLRDIGS